MNDETEEQGDSTSKEPDVGSFKRQQLSPVLLPYPTLRRLDQVRANIWAREGLLASRAMALLFIMDEAASLHMQVMALEEKVLSLQIRNRKLKDRLRTERKKHGCKESKEGQQRG